MMILKLYGAPHAEVYKRLVRAAGFFALALLVLTPAAFNPHSYSHAQVPTFKAMAEDADPTFEVATIKPSMKDVTASGIAVKGDIFHANNMTARALLAVAFEVQEGQIVGGPSWLDDLHYDVSGRPDAQGQPNERQWNSMLRKLLIDRLNLKFSLEKKPMSSYAIFVNKGGPKLKRAVPTSAAHASMYFTQPGKLVARQASMNEFCGLLQSVVLDRPVVNNTGLDGNWDFDLTWQPDSNQFHGQVPLPSKEDGNDASAAASLPSALREQIGLELKAGKYPVAVIAVNSASQPPAN